MVLLAFYRKWLAKEDPSTLRVDFEISLTSTDNLIDVARQNAWFRVFKDRNL